jgi:hypothetical protein
MTPYPEVGLPRVILTGNAMARETCPAMLMITSSPTPDSDSWFTSV